MMLSEGKMTHSRAVVLHDEAQRLIKRAEGYSDGADHIPTLPQSVLERERDETCYQAKLASRLLWPERDFRDHAEAAEAHYEQDQLNQMAAAWEPGDEL